MYLDVRVEDSSGNSLAADCRLVPAAGEVPSEPGGVEARSIPFGVENGAREI
jgi:hypothetical protein